MPSTELFSQPAKRCFGLMSRRERWGLSLKGWIALWLVIGLIGMGVLRSIHPFLAVTAPVESPVLVVEAWVPPAVLKAVADRYGAEARNVFYCTGGPTDEAFDSTRVEDTSAAEAAQILGGYGIPAERLHVVPHWGVPRDRTYANATTLREWFQKNNVSVTAINVLTEGLHSRRSRLLFEKAFGPGVRVGVVAIPDRTYDAGRWWRYSEGIKAVISESAGYLYARFLFRPAEG